ncbi:MAG: pyridoxal-phosphate dependent enzyme, partial [Acidobacteriota bacterium]
VHAAFDEVARIEREEGRTFIHPFEGPTTVLGTATLGLEMIDQWAAARDAGETRADAPDAVVVQIGGGGLCAGIAAAIKQRWPDCAVYGVEPDGADTMHRSIAAGRPMAIERVRTCADSLGAPHAAPHTFALCRRFVDHLVRIDDDQIRAAMALLFRDAKLAVEPAGAAAVAALLGPLAAPLRDRRVLALICGSNPGLTTFADLTREASAAVPAGGAVTPVAQGAPT